MALQYRIVYHQEIIAYNLIFIIVIVAFLAYISKREDINLVILRNVDNTCSIISMCLTGVRLYQGVLNRTIPNYAMIAGRDFAERDWGSIGLGDVGFNDSLNDGLWCQSAMNVSGIGSWKLPNGNAVPDDLNADPIHTANRPGQVGLLRSTGIGSSPYQGMYTCTIPDENGVSQTLVVWAAASTAYDGTNEECEFKYLLSHINW